MPSISKAGKGDTSKGLFNVASEPTPSLSVCVVVPARNEAKNIKKTLDALRKQTCSKGLPLPQDDYEVLLLANNCTDKTFFLAEKYRKQYPEFRLYNEEIQLPAKCANIGTVRRLLMDAAYSRLSKNGTINGIIASTDGDTTVDTNWIYFTKKEIRKGNDAVGGRIFPHKISAGIRLQHLRDATYRLLLAKAESLIDADPNDPWPRHFQYFGASLAVTCEMYHKCGRLPQVPFLEDGAFHRLLYLSDAKIRKSPTVKVYTSSRMSGRVKVGFSEQLKKWNSKNKTNDLQMVGSVKAQLLNYEIRNAIRNCWKNEVDGNPDADSIIKLAEFLSLEVKWLTSEISSCKYFGKFWEKILQQKGFKQKIKVYQVDIPITQAISELRSFLRQANV